MIMYSLGHKSRENFGSSVINMQQSRTKLHRVSFWINLSSLSLIGKCDADTYNLHSINNTPAWLPFLGTAGSTAGFCDLKKVCHVSTKPENNSLMGGEIWKCYGCWLSTTMLTECYSKKGKQRPNYMRMSEF